MKTSTLWLWVFWACSGCLPSKQALDKTASDIEVLDLSVRDQRGGSWPLSAVPRSLRLELRLSATPEQPDKRIWLVAGSLDDPLAEDLLNPPLRKEHEQRLQTLSVTPSDGGVIASAHALTRGQRYTLVILEAPEQLWSQELQVSESPAAGASFIESLPADQARGAAPNLQSILLRFDGYLANTSHVTLHSGDSPLPAKTEFTRCSDVGLAEGDCLFVTPSGTLPPHASLDLRVDELSDATGAALDAIALHFETGGHADTETAELLALTCALDERPLDAGGCALEQDHTITLRFAVDEPVLATLTTAQQTRSALSFGRNVEIRLDGLASDRALPSSLRLMDLAGNERSMTFTLATQPLLAALSIDEVRCDPIGAEPAQETIELLNFGGEPIQIMGFSVSDDALEPGVLIRDELAVLPGERVLVVGPAFDARDESDGKLSPGVRLARTDKALSLNNEGSVIFLRDKQMRRLSASPRVKPAQAGSCVARVTDDPRSDAPGSFASAPSQTCTPGSETPWP